MEGNRDLNKIAKFTRYEVVRVEAPASDLRIYQKEKDTWLLWFLLAIGCVLTGLVVVGAQSVNLSERILIGAILGMVFVLPVLGFMCRAWKEIIRIDRKSGSISCRRFYRLGITKQHIYSLKNFETVELVKYLHTTSNGQGSTRRSIYFILALRGPGTRCEIFRAYKDIPDALVQHCRELASFLHLEFRDYSKFTSDDAEHIKAQEPIILLFGNIQAPQKPRGIVLSNYDFEQEYAHFHISHVYLDTQTCDLLLVEKFITYTVNSISKKGRKSIRVVYCGELDDLGDHLKNALRNTFAQIETLDERPSVDECVHGG